MKYAADLNGVTAIENRIVVRKFVSNQDLAKNVKKALENYKDIRYQLQDSRVFITGRVENEDDRRSIMKAIGDLDGIDAIESQIGVMPKDSNARSK